MIQTIKQLYFRYKELINYVIVGGLTTVVSLTSYYFFTTAFLDPQDPFQLTIRSHGSAQFLLLISQTESSFLKVKALINCAKC